MAERTRNAPRQEDYSFDLSKVYASMVSVRSHIPEDAHTASTLGTERGGNGIVIRSEGVVLTIGYLITEAETIWLTDHTGKAVQGHVLGYDQETGFGLVQALGRLDVEAIEIGRSAGVREGDPVIMAGFGGRSGSVSAEVIAVREFAGYWEYLLDEAIFSAPAHPNWGGAGLIGSKGELLGVGSCSFNTAGPGTGGGRQHGGADRPAGADLRRDDHLGRPNKKPRPWMGLFWHRGRGPRGRRGAYPERSGGPGRGRGGRHRARRLGQPVKSLADMFRRSGRSAMPGSTMPLALGRDGEIIQANLSTIARSDLLKGPKLH